MKKNVYISILSVVTVLCIICGTVWHMTGCSAMGISGDKRVVVTQQLEAFDSFYIDTDIMDVEIVSGNEYAIYYDAVKNYEPTYKIEAGKLIVNQKEDRGKGWFTGLGSNSEMEMRITVPADVTLSAIETSSDVGEVTIKGIAFEKGTMGTDVGDILVDTCEFKYLDIESDVGETEIKLTGQAGEYTMELLADVGEIEVEDFKQGNTFKQSGTSDKVLIINSDVGDIEVE